MFRTAPFRFHPAAGLRAGVVVLIMSVAGLALAVDSQSLDRGPGRAWSAPPSTVVNHLSPETLPAPERTMQPVAAPAMRTPMADAEAPAAVLFEQAGATALRPSHGVVPRPADCAVRFDGRVAAGCRRLRAAAGPPSSRAA